MSFVISSSVYPTASSAAIFAIGNPVAFEASARRARDARVHLDQDLAAGARVDGELHVRAAGLDADRADARERRVAHPLVLAVGQRHAPAPP